MSVEEENVQQTVGETPVEESAVEETAAEETKDDGSEPADIKKVDMTQLQSYMTKQEYLGLCNKLAMTEVVDQRSALHAMVYLLNLAHIREAFVIEEQDKMRAAINIFRPSGSEPL